MQESGFSYLRVPKGETENAAWEERSPFVYLKIVLVNPSILLD